MFNTRLGERKSYRTWKLISFSSRTTNCSADRGLTLLDWPANSPEPEPEPEPEPYRESKGAFRPNVIDVNTIA